MADAGNLSRLTGTPQMSPQRATPPQKLVQDTGGALPTDRAHFSGPTSDNVYAKKFDFEKAGSALSNGKFAALALAGVTSAGLGLASSLSYGGIGLMMGGIGAVVGGLATLGPSDWNQVTNSGIKVHHHTPGLLGSSLYSSFGPGLGDHAVSDYNLPNGQELRVFEHRILTARDAQGHALKTELVKDQAGNDVYRITNNQGVITELHSGSLDLTMMSPRTTSEEGNLVSDLRALKQTVHSDGTSELIVGEKSQAVKQTVEDPLHVGEFKTDVVPKQHSYTKVELSAGGDSSVEEHTRNFGLAHKANGDLRSTNHPEVVHNEGLSTSFGTRGETFSVEGGQAGETEVRPFVSLDQMQEARTHALDSLLAEKTKGFAQPERFQDGPRTWVFDAQGDRVAIQGGELPHSFGVTYTHHVAGGVGSSPTFDGKGSAYLADNEGQLVRVDGYGAHTLAKMDGKLVGDPAFDADGNLTVMLEKGNFTIQRAYNPATGAEVHKQIVHS